MAISPFPWSALEAVTRSGLRDMARVRRVIGRPRIARLESVLTELTGASVRVFVRGIDGARRGRDLGARTAIAFADETHVELDVEPDLVARVIGHLLGRPAALEHPGAALDDALRGGFAAVLVETARRVTGIPVRLAEAARPVDDSVRVAATVVFDECPYEAVARIRTAWPPVLPLDLGALGPLPIGVPIVAASSTVPRSLLSELEPGSAWMPGKWTIRDNLTGNALLAAPLGETGLPVELVRDGSIVLRGHPVALSWDAELPMTESNQEPSVSDAVLDAPIVVRVEVGTVTLTAREWAELGPGDVIETGRRIAEPVTLRVAGQEVARGELVNVEGELGVRIRELVGRGEPSR